MATHWWQNAVVYQIYPRSFCDSNGDGLGDLPGILSKLDYIQSLGVDAVWLSPVFRSPQDDNGYDVADYQDIDPIFGTMTDMQALLAEAKKRNIRILMDMVLNHTSDEHAWFRESSSSRTNPKQDWYVWRDGVPGTPPNDMRSSFGGSAWQWCESRGQYYLHQYSVKQPDLNWDNPDVRHALYDMMNWWIDQGVSGFRFDVIDSVAKEPDRIVTVEGTNLHSYIREMSEAVFRGKELLTVGEVWSADCRRAQIWSAPDGSELSMVFLLETSLIDQGISKWDLEPFRLTRLKAVIRRWQEALHGRGWAGLAWENHDLPRVVSRWGHDGMYHDKSAMMLSTVLYGLEGTPFLYQGQEIGMTNAPFREEDFQDIEIRNQLAQWRSEGRSPEEMLHPLLERGRDNARTPMQWDASPNAGFTTGKPWLMVNPNFPEINVAAQDQSQDSVLNYHRYLISLRKRLAVITQGDYQDLCPQREDLYAYRRDDGRQQLTVIANFTDHEIPVPRELLEESGEPQLSNYPTWPENAHLRPYETAMYLKA